MKSCLGEADLDVLLVVVPREVIPVKAGHSTAPAVAVISSASANLSRAENEHESNDFENLVEEQDPEASKS